MPETKWGKCEWCGRHEQMVKLMAVPYEGRMVLGWICPRCMDVCQRGLYGKREEKKEGKG